MAVASVLVLASTWSALPWRPGVSAYFFCLGATVEILAHRARGFSAGAPIVVGVGVAIGNILFRQETSSLRQDAHEVAVLLLSMVAGMAAAGAWVKSSKTAARTITDAELWGRVRVFFEEDEGALHTIRLQRLSGATLVMVARKLQHAGRVSPVLAWDNTAAVEVRPADLGFAAEGVVAGDLDPVHVLVSAPDFGRGTIPDLGVRVSRDEVVLDYRRGPDWTPTAVASLFDLLAQLSNVSTDVRVSLHESVLPERQAEFASALSWFRAMQRPA
jgi:hypothetical protein